MEILLYVLFTIFIYVVVVSLTAAIYEIKFGPTSEEFDTTLELFDNTSDKKWVISSFWLFTIPLYIIILIVKFILRFPVLLHNLFISVFSKLAETKMTNIRFKLTKLKNFRLKKPNFMIKKIKVKQTEEFF